GQELAGRGSGVAQWPGGERRPRDGVASPRSAHRRGEVVLRRARGGVVVTRVVQSVAELREVIAGLPRPLHLVPTMGALHAGHAALLDAARAGGVAVVMSLFVNPLQFNDAADLDAYPRAFERDVEIAESHAVDVVWAPAVSEMHPVGRPPSTV